MGSLSGATKLQRRTDVERLVGITIDMMTPEKLAEVREDYPTMPLQVSLKIETEPLSFLVEGPHGNRNFDYIPITKGRGLSELDGMTEEQARAQVEELGIGGIPSSVMISVPQNKKIASLERYFQRWQRYNDDLGIDVEFDDEGVFHSDDFGKVFNIENGSDTYPVWLSNDGEGMNDEYGISVPKRGFGRWSTPGKPIPGGGEEPGKDRYCRYFVARNDDFVIPADEDRPVIHRTSDDESSEATEATTSGGSGDLDVDALREAVEALGGAEAVGNLTKADIARAVPDHAILALPAVQKAVKEGKLIEFLEQNGVLSA